MSMCYIRDELTSPLIRWGRIISKSTKLFKKFFEKDFLAYFLYGEKKIEFGREFRKKNLKNRKKRRAAESPFREILQLCRRTSIFNFTYHLASLVLKYLSTKCLLFQYRFGHILNSLYTCFNACLLSILYNFSSYTGNNRRSYTYNNFSGFSCSIFHVV